MHALVSQSVMQFPIIIQLCTLSLLVWSIRYLIVRSCTAPIERYVHVAMQIKIGISQWIHTRLGSRPAGRRRDLYVLLLITMELSLAFT